MNKKTVMPTAALHSRIAGIATMFEEAIGEPTSRRLDLKKFRMQFEK
jgi:hypothetical protein